MSTARKNPAAEELASLVRSLAAQRISAVTYWSLDYGDGETHWGDFGERFDVLDFGFELHLENGSEFAVTWSRDFGAYGVFVHRGRMAELFSPEIEMLAAPAGDRWKEFLGKTIVGAELQWRPVPDLDGEYPTMLALRFAGDRAIWVAAATYNEDDDQLEVDNDNLVVLSDPALARRYRLL